MPSPSGSLRIMAITAALAVGALKVFNTAHGLTLDYLEAAAQPDCEFHDSIGLTPELIEQILVRAGDHEHSKPELLVREGDRTPGYLVHKVSAEACERAIDSLQPIGLPVYNGEWFTAQNPSDLRPPRPAPDVLES